MTPIGMKSPRRPPRERPSEELLASKYTTPCFFASLDLDHQRERCPECGGTQDSPKLVDGPPLLSPMFCRNSFHDPTQHVCDGPMDLFHFISAQRLRAAHAPVWDPRVVGVGCRAGHHRLDNYFLRIPRDQLPPAVEEYAAEFGLSWSLSRDYPERTTDG